MFKNLFIIFLLFQLSEYIVYLDFIVKLDFNQPLIMIVNVVFLLGSRCEEYCPNEYLNLTSEAILCNLHNQLGKYFVYV